MKRQRHPILTLPILNAALAGAVLDGPFQTIVRSTKRPAAALKLLEQKGVKDFTLENRLEIRAAANGDEYEIDLIGTVGNSWLDENGITEKEVRSALKDIPEGKPITINVNSEGGSVKEGNGIGDAIYQRRADIKIRVTGYALSIASVFPQSARKTIGGRGVVSPPNALWMEHEAWTGAMGNKRDFRKAADMLQAHDDTLVNLYARGSGKGKQYHQDRMEKETWTTGSDAVAAGLADETDEQPVAQDAYRPLHADYIERCKNIPDAILNCIKPISAPAQGAANQPQPPTKENIVNRESKIALLASWGLTVPADIADARLDELIAMGKTKAGKAMKAKKGEAEKREHDPDDPDDPDCDTCMEKSGKKNAAPPAPILDDKTIADLEHLKTEAANRRRSDLRGQIEHLASFEGGNRIPLNEVDGWLQDALAAQDKDGVNPVIARLQKLEAKAPGAQPVSVELNGDSAMSVAQLDRAVNALLEPQKFYSANRTRPDRPDRENIGARAKQISALLNSLKKFDAKGILIGPLRDAWDKWAAGVQNANTMSADLLRQLILSEIMRAFKRQFATLSIFSHYYGNVALEGNDYVKVPYYPLDTVASTEFSQAAGYVIAPNAQTLSKSILVGGKGDGTTTAGSGRKYKGLQFSAYEIRRQPWLNIAQLTVMAAEQLAVDVRADILGAFISQANFGNTIWSGAAGAFSRNIVATYLLNAAIKAYWPQQMRHVVLAPDYYTNLLADPALQYIGIGSPEPSRAGIIGELMGFADVNYDALYPVANYIRGGDGVVTNGGAPNDAGFIAYPSALLIATAPIMPGPATLRLMASYEQVTDDQSGLTFTYQYFGNLLGSNDNEIIECAYGGGLGELAALKRIGQAGVV